MCSASLMIKRQCPVSIKQEKTRDCEMHKVNSVRWTWQTCWMDGLFFYRNYTRNDQSSHKRTEDQGGEAKSSTTNLVNHSVQVTMPQICREVTHFLNMWDCSQLLFLIKAFTGMEGSIGHVERVDLEERDASYLSWLLGRKDRWMKDGPRRQWMQDLALRSYPSLKKFRRDISPFIYGLQFLPEFSETEGQQNSIRLGGRAQRESIRPKSHNW